MFLGVLLFLSPTCLFLSLWQRARVHYRMAAAEAASARKSNQNSMAPITAFRIEALLLQPHDMRKARLWNIKCAGLISDLRALERENNSPELPDLTRWTSKLRPKWKVRGIPPPNGMEFVSPLFAWFYISLWPVATDENVSGLFHVLMRCGCNSAAALGATTRSGHVVLQFAAASTAFVRGEKEESSDDDDDQDYFYEGDAPWRKRAVVELTGQPNLPLFSAAAALPDPDSVVDRLSGPYCCAFCTFVCNKLDSHAVDVLARINPTQRLAILSAPHYGFAHASKFSCMRTFMALWRAALERMKQPDFGGATEIDRIIGGPANAEGTRIGAFSCATMWGDALAWRLVTDRNCPLAVAMLRHANEHSDRQYLSPMTMIVGHDQTEEEADIRGEWLVSRLRQDVLNAYLFTDHTPLMAAAKYELPKTLTALLDRGVEVDLTTTSRPDASACDDKKIIPMTAVDMIHNDDIITAKFRPAAARLRIETKARFAQHSLIVVAAVPVLQQVGGAQMPRELVSICLAYAGLPQPVALPAPSRSIFVGAKRGTISASSGVVDARERAELSSKRLRLT